MEKIKNKRESVFNKSIKGIAEDDGLDSKKIFDSLKKHANNLDDIKKEIDKLQLQSKKLFKEKALASIQRELEIDQAKANDIATFIVPTLFTIIGFLFGNNIVSLVMFVLLLLILCIVLRVIDNYFKNRNNIKIFRLIKFIEDLDTTEETTTYSFVGEITFNNTFVAKNPVEHSKNNYI